MPKATRRSLSATLLPLSLERGVELSLQRQLFEQLRELILGGRVKPGARLPSTRALAEELACSRNTVIGAYDQLFAEGYLECESGSGTYVSRVLPEELLRADLGRSGSLSPTTPSELNPWLSPSQSAGHPAPALSKRGASLAAIRRDHPRQYAAFSPGMPETAHFPWETWNRLLGRTWRQPDRSLVRHGEAGGYAPLRKAIAKYLAAVRGVNCDWHQVIITSGGQQCIDLTVKALTDPGDRVWVEEPGYTGLRGPLLAAGVEVVPIPIDPEGLDLEGALARAGDARLAIVTPSHQYPLGIVMSLARRLQLLEWARESGSYILEDDYDSEYRYAGRPLSALQGLDRGARVIYAGSFSKVLFPSLRLGYLVVPESLADSMVALRRSIDDHPSSLAQPVLAEFFEEGHFAAHLRRSRRLYAERQKVLLDAASQKLGGVLNLTPDEAGLHLVADLADQLRARMTDRQAAKQAADAGITAPPLSDFYLGHADRQGLLLGYAAVPEAKIREKVSDLAVALS